MSIMQAELVRAAREALNTHEALESCRECEPRLTTDQRQWLAWHHDSYQPARRAWAKAIDSLEALMGEGLSRRKSGAWKSVCVRILSGELR